MACGAGVEDGPILDGTDVEINGAEQGSGGESILVGGGRATIG